MGSFILFLGVLVFRFFGHERDANLFTSSQNPPYFAHIDNRYQEKIIQKKQVNIQETRKVEKVNICADLPAYIDTLKLFEVDLTEKRIVHDLFMNMAKRIEENMNKYNERVLGMGGRSVFCESLVEQFSDLTWLISHYSREDESFPSMIKTMYVALSIKLLEIKSYDRLIKAMGLFMNVIDLNYFGLEERTELYELFNRVEDDFKRYKSYRQMNPSENEGPDKNLEADYLLFRDWLAKLNY